MTRLIFGLVICAFISNANANPYRFLQGSEEKIALNIVTPPDGLGGFGDLTSNLYMGEKLSALGYKVNLFIDTSFKDKFNLLNILPTNDFTEIYLGEKNNIHYYRVPTQKEISELNFPLSSEYTIYTSFSSQPPTTRYTVSQQEIAHGLLNFIKKGWFVFEEYSGFDKQVLPYLRFNVFNKETNGFVLLTGPTQLGMYISAEKPEFINAKTSLIQKYFNVHQEEISNEQKLGFVYTKGRGLANVFFAGLNQFAQEQPSTQFYVISRFEPHSSIKLAKNIHISHRPSLSFEDTKSLIASSDLPLLITGDMSLTLAVEYEKEFFYEHLGHKFAIDDELRSIFGFSDLPKLSFATDRDALNPSIVAFEEEFSTLSGSPDTSYVSVYKVDEYINAIKEGLQWFNKNPHQMANGIASIRKKISLPARFGDILKSRKNSFMNLKESSIIGEPEYHDGLVNFVKNKIEDYFSDKSTEKTLDLIERLNQKNIAFKLSWSDNNAQKQATFDSLKQAYERQMKIDPWVAEDEIKPEIESLLKTAKLEISPTSEILEKLLEGNPPIFSGIQK